MKNASWSRSHWPEALRSSEQPQRVRSRRFEERRFHHANPTATTTIQGSQASTTALKNSTEDEQFFDKPKAELHVA